MVIGMRHAAAPAFVEDWLAELPEASLHELTVDPAAVAIVSADLVVGFCSSGNLASPRIGALAAPAAELFRRAHDRGVRHFLLLQDTHDPHAVEFGAFPPHCVRDTHESDTVPELAELPFADGFTVLPKNSVSPAPATGMDGWLDEHPDVRTFIVVGDCTDICVYQTATHLRARADAMNLSGVRVVVPRDLVDTYDLPADEAVEVTAMAHPGDFFHDVFLYHLALLGCDVVATIR